MSSPAELRARLETQLRVLLGLGPADPLDVDGSGDVAVTWGSALATVRLLERDPPLVTVFAVVLASVARTTELLEVLNDMNAGIVSARVFWADGAVVAASDVPAEGLGTDELEHALWAVGSFTDWAGPQLGPRFGGLTGAG